MLNDSVWRQINENQYSLYNEKDGMIAILSYDEYTDTYEVDDHSDYSDVVKARTIEEALWMATVILSNYYNRLIGEYMKRRDCLPSLGELYDNAFKTTINKQKEFDQDNFDWEVTNPNNGHSDRERDSYGNNN